MDKKANRSRRATATRKHIQKLQVARLTVHRSNQHIYAQVIRPDGSVVAAANTLQKGILSDGVGAKNKESAGAVGRKLASAALLAGVDRVAFDRSGFKYHGRIAALADAAREAGLKF